MGNILGGRTLSSIKANQQQTTANNLQHMIMLKSGKLVLSLNSKWLQFYTPFTSAVRLAGGGAHVRTPPGTAVMSYASRLACRACQTLAIGPIHLEQLTTEW